MSKKERTLALLKVLAAAAWADGRVDADEINHIKTIALRAGLDVHDLADIEELLDHPIPNTACETLTRELLATLATDADRRQALEQIEALFAADGEVADAERQLLLELQGVMSSASALDGFLSRISGVFRGVFGSAQRRQSVAQGHSSPVFARMDRLSNGEWRGLMDEGLLSVHVLYAAVLGKLADTEDGKSPSELQRIRELLQDRRRLGPPLLDWIMEAVTDTAHAEMDRQRLLSEYNRVAGMPERLDLLDAAFAVGAADRTLSPAELAELRLISNYLWIDARDFNAVRTRWQRSLT